MIVKRGSRTNARRTPAARGPPRAIGNKVGGSRFSVLENMEVDGIGGISNYGVVSPEIIAQLPNLAPKLLQ